MLTISNLIITDLTNSRVASATNPSPFGYYYSKHIRSIYLNLLTSLIGPIPNLNPSWVTPSKLWDCIYTVYAYNNYSAYCYSSC